MADNHPPISDKMLAPLTLVFIAPFKYHVTALSQPSLQNVRIIHMPNVLPWLSMHILLCWRLFVCLLYISWHLCKIFISNAIGNHMPNNCIAVCNVCGCCFPGILGRKGSKSFFLTPSFNGIAQNNLQPACLVLLGHSRLSLIRENASSLLDDAIAHSERLQALLCNLNLHWDSQGFRQHLPSHGVQRYCLFS